MKVVSIDAHFCPQNWLIAIATSFRRPQNKHQINHLHTCIYQHWKFGEDWFCKFGVIWWQMPTFSHFFTRVHKWASWFPGLLDRSLPNLYTMQPDHRAFHCMHWHRIFQSLRNAMPNYGLLQILAKIGCHGNAPWAIGKRRPDPQNTIKYLSYGKKSWKSVQ